MRQVFSTAGRPIFFRAASSSFGFDGDVFKFVGDEFEAAGESFKRGLIAEVRGDALCDAAHGGFRRGIEKTEVQTERIARESEHVAQLTAAEDTDGHLPLPFLTG